MPRRRELETGEDIFTWFAGQTALSVVRRRLLPVPAPFSCLDAGFAGATLPLCGVFVHSAPWSMHRDIAVSVSRAERDRVVMATPQPGAGTPGRPVRSVVGIGRPQAA